MTYRRMPTAAAAVAALAAGLAGGCASSPSFTIRNETTTHAAVLVQVSTVRWRRFSLTRSTREVEARRIEDVLEPGGSKTYRGGSGERVDEPDSLEAKSGAAVAARDGSWFLISIEGESRENVKISIQPGEVGRHQISWRGSGRNRLMNNKTEVLSWMDGYR